jgi:hypothetical protein
LQGRYWLHGVSPPDDVHPGFGQAEVLYFAGIDEFPSPRRRPSIGPARPANAARSSRTELPLRTAGVVSISDVRGPGAYRYFSPQWRGALFRGAQVLEILVFEVKPGG